MEKLDQSIFLLEQAEKLIAQLGDEGAPLHHARHETNGALHHLRQYRHFKQRDRDMDDVARTTGAGAAEAPPGSESASDAPGAPAT